MKPLVAAVTVLVALALCVPVQAQTPEIDALRVRAEAGEGYCQVDENRCDRPTRYCGRSPSWADMLGIRIGLMPQLDSALPLAGRGCNAAAYGSRGLRRAGE